ncbi:uncharacterized protein J4E79_011817 [Alternaria viburni]|uniref:uncharacterized protein n=1 Tax=Alternaria viburni TaxID=566460 RepID=UPI0020C3207C|nr:uncharacterized protein J4E79_011817 [Alternaria viburni]KAI4640547.1 hypothetical protein J4E79_011817 [Alternaria viburni]
MSPRRRDSKMAGETSHLVVKADPASPSPPQQQLLTPPSSTVRVKREVLSPEDEVEASPTATKGSKRKRSATPDDSDYEPQPVATSKKAKPTVTPKRKPRKKKTKTPAELAAAAEKARLKAANEERIRKTKQGRIDWKEWLANNQNDDDKNSLDAIGIDCLTKTMCDKQLGLNKDDLKALPFEERLNPNGASFAAMRLYSYSDALRLACRKEAILAGYSQDNEEILMEIGRELLQDKKGKDKQRRGGSESDSDSEVVCGPCESNMPSIEYLMARHESQWGGGPKVYNGK